VVVVSLVVDILVVVVVVVLVVVGLKVVFISMVGSRVVVVSFGNGESGQSKKGKQMVSLYMWKEQRISTESSNPFFVCKSHEQNSTPFCSKMPTQDATDDIFTWEGPSKIAQFCRKAKSIFQSYRAHTLSMSFNSMVPFCRDL